MCLFSLLMYTLGVLVCVYIYIYIVYANEGAFKVAIISVNISIGMFI